MGRVDASMNGRILSLTNLLNSPLLLCIVVIVVSAASATYISRLYHQIKHINREIYNFRLVLIDEHSKLKLDLANLASHDEIQRLRDYILDMQKEINRFNVISQCEQIHDAIKTHQSQLTNIANQIGRLSSHISILERLYENHSTRYMLSDMYSNDTHFTARYLKDLHFVLLMHQDTNNRLEQLYRSAENIMK